MLLAVGASFSDPTSRPPRRRTSCLPRPRVGTGADGGGGWGSMLMVGAGGRWRRRRGAVRSPGPHSRIDALVVSRLGAIESRGSRRRCSSTNPTRAMARSRTRFAYTSAATPVVFAPRVREGRRQRRQRQSSGFLPAFATRRFASSNIATGLLFAARGLGARCSARSSCAR